MLRNVAMGLFLTATGCELLLSIACWAFAILQVEPPGHSDLIRVLFFAGLPAAAFAFLLSLATKGMGNKGFARTAESFASLPRLVLIGFVALPLFVLMACWLALMLQTVVFGGLPEPRAGGYATTTRSGDIVKEVPKWDFVASEWIALASVTAFSSFLCSFGLAAVTRDHGRNMASNDFPVAE